MNKEIDLSKHTYRTVEGCPIEIHKMEKENTLPYYGLIYLPEGTTVCARWSTWGKSPYHMKYDLIPVPKELKVCILKYDDGSFYITDWDKLTSDKQESYRKCPFWLGLSTVVLPEKE